MERLNDSAGFRKALSANKTKRTKSPGEPISVEMLEVFSFLT